MTVSTASLRFIHNREIAPRPTWEQQVLQVRSFVTVSDDSRLIACRERSILDSYRNVTSFRGPLEWEFFERARRWKAETFFHSSILKKTMHPDYQRIIGMGAPVVPLILQRLRRGPDFWFDALVAITGEQPVPAEDAGNMEAMTRDWLSWGQANGYDC